jgi:hypothetical protein
MTSTIPLCPPPRLTGKGIAAQPLALAVSAHQLRTLVEPRTLHDLSIPWFQPIKNTQKAAQHTNWVQRNTSLHPRSTNPISAAPTRGTTNQS